MPNNDHLYQQSSSRHQHQHQRSRDEIDTRVVNDIFPTTTTTMTNSFHNNRHQLAPTAADQRRTGSPNLQQDPHLLSAVRDSVHFGSSPTTTTTTTTGKRGSNPIDARQAGNEMRRSNSPFDDQYAATTTMDPVPPGTAAVIGGMIDQPAGRSDNQLGGIVHASGESRGVVGKDRVRFDRSGSSGPARTPSANSIMTTASNPLLRRAPASSDAIPNNSNTTSTSTIRLVAPVEKRPSRHADVIDKWDGSGLGKSMWHHSGPYDAAAPSRNDAKERGAERAPMGVFDPRKGSKVTELDVKALQSVTETTTTSTPTPTMAQSGAGAGAGVGQARPQQGRFRSGSITRVTLGDPKASPGLEQQVVIPSLTNSGAIPMTARPSRPGRKTSINSPGIYGSLQEEYSNNLPSSGGYFETGSPRAVGSPGKRISMGPAGDEEEEERRIRQRERDQKRRALQAAWGIDEPEPYEDFGGYAQNDVDSMSLNDNAEPATLPVSPANEGSRSPGKAGGLSMGGIMRTTSRNANGNNRYTPSPAAEKSEYFTGRPPMDGDRVLSPGPTADGNAGGKGVKRTRSLMQRFRAMRDNPNVPVTSDAPMPRTGSPGISVKAGRHSPWNEDTLGIMDEGTATNGQQPREAVTNPPTLQLGREDGGVRRQGSFLGRRKTSRSNVAAMPPSPVEPREEILITQEPEPRRPSPGYGAKAGGREKALPPPPAPVMPVFNDQFADMTLKPPTEGSGVQRKTSLMKKLKARIG